MTGSTNRTRAAWRSLLFVPAMVEKFVEKAASLRADAVIIDLEDSVLHKEKEVARGRVAEIARLLRTEGRDVVVRINRPLSLAVRDIEMAVGPDVDAIMIAKTSSAEHLSPIGEVITERETALGLALGRTAIVPLLETLRRSPSSTKFALSDVLWPWSAETRTSPRSSVATRPLIR